MTMPRDEEAPGPDKQDGKQPRLFRFVGRISGKAAGELTDKQLRAARRLAAKRGLEASSDQDAVQQLKALVEKGRTNGDAAPARQRGKPASPAPAPAPDPERSFDIIHEIEADLVNRRRAGLRRMLLRVGFLVVLPALLATGYFAFVATPMYATYSDLVIQKPEGGGAVEGLGLLAGFPGSSQQESASVQGYLASRSAMLELMRTQGFRDSLTSPDIDPLQRLSPDAGTEEAYRQYGKRVRVSYDPNDRVVRLQVIAPQPEQALRYAKALIGLAEDHVDQMSERLRADRMRGAEQAYQTAEARLAAAREKVLSLQRQRGILSADLEASSRMSQITALQSALVQKRLELAEMDDATHPSAGRIKVASAAIDRLEAMIADLRAGMTAGDDKTASLARVGAELLSAQAELQLRQGLVSQAVQLLEAARMEADRQSVYLATSVAPVLPDEPAYPNVLRNAALAFLLLGGLYLLLSLTYSILREQIGN